MEPMLLRVEEAAKVLGLGRSKTYELVLRGVIPSITIDKSRRVPAHLLKQWVAERSAEAENGQTSDSVKVA